MYINDELFNQIKEKINLESKLYLHRIAIVIAINVLGRIMHY